MWQFYFLKIEKGGADVCDMRWGPYAVWRVCDVGEGVLIVGLAFSCVFWRFLVAGVGVGRVGGSLIATVVLHSGLASACVLLPTAHRPQTTRPSINARSCRVLGCLVHMILVVLTPCDGRYGMGFVQVVPA